MLVIRRFMLSGLLALLVVGVVSCHKSSRGAYGVFGGEAQQEEESTQYPEESESAEFMLPAGVTSADFTIEGDGVRMELRLWQVMSEGHNWSAMMEGDIYVAKRDEFDDAAGRQYTIRPCKIQREGVRDVVVMVERSEAGVGEGTAAVEISALRINMTSKGEKTRQGRVESVGRFMMQYSTTVMGLNEVTDLALESYMQNALITLTHFR